MDTQFLSISLLMSFILVLPLILFLVISLILKYVFRTRNRILNAVITLIISLAIASSLLWILSEFGVVGPVGLIFPWSNLDTVCYSGHGMDYSPDPDGASIVSLKLSCLICRIIQLEEYILIIIAALVIIVPPVMRKIKEVMKKS
jgi:hypothetical protein